MNGMTRGLWGRWNIGQLAAIVCMAAVGTPAAAADAELSTLIEAAKKEGEVHYLDAVAQPKTNAAMERAFKKKYGLPEGFKFTHTLQGTGQVVASAQQEIKAGQHTFDVVWVGAPSFFRAAGKEGHFLAHVPPEWRLYEREVKRMGVEADPPHWLTPVGYAFVPVWNRKCAGFGSVRIKSWRDLQNPAFKGKLIVSDVRKSFAYTASWVAMEGTLGKDYFPKLVELTRPAIFFRTEEVMQKSVSCEYPIALWQLPGRVYQRVAEDPTLDLGIAWPEEGVAVLSAPIAVLKGAPHPNAARLLVDFLLSEDGMRELVSGEMAFSFRDGLKVPEAVRKYVPEIGEVKVLPVNWAQLNLQETKRIQDDFRKVLGVD